MKTHQILRALLVSLSLTSATAYAQSWLPFGDQICDDIPAAEAIAVAASRGYQFSISRTSATSGRCWLRGTGKVIAMAHGVEDTEDLTCEGTFFAGRNLAAGWTFGNSYEFSTGIEITRSPSKGDRDIRVEFRKRKQPGAPSTFRLRRISLQGPDCDDWRDAFN